SSYGAGRVAAKHKIPSCATSEVPIVQIRGAHSPVEAGHFSRCAPLRGDQHVGNGLRLHTQDFRLQVPGLPTQDIPLRLERRNVKRFRYYKHSAPLERERKANSATTNIPLRWSGERKAIPLLQTFRSAGAGNDCSQGLGAGAFRL